MYNPSPHLGTPPVKGSVSRKAGKSDKPDQLPIPLIGVIPPHIGHTPLYWDICGQ